MTNSYYNATGNPATGAEGLSALIRAEFADIAAGFDRVSGIQTTGLYTTTLTQQGNYTFTLPAQPGTLALVADVTAEATVRAAADATLTTTTASHTASIASINTAVALLAPKASPTFTGTVAVPTALTADNSTQPASTAWVRTFLAASGYAPTGTNPVTSVAGRTGAVTLTHSDLTDWAATLTPYALLASPTFTGIPAAPTATAGNSSTQLATTSFVSTAVANEATARDAAIAAATGGSPTFSSVTAANANISGNVTAGNYGAVRGSTGTFTGGITSNGYNVVTANGSNYAINISGSAASCTGNSVTATTATNQSGGTVNCTSLVTSSTGTFNNTIFAKAPTVGGASATVHVINSTACFMAVFQYTLGNTVGSITSNGSSVSYNATSDYRCKVTYGPWLDGAGFDAVRVHEASFKLAPAVRQPMFLAHELQEAGFGYAVRGVKDGAELQQVDHPSLIPALWAMVQDLRARVAQLEAR